MSIKEFVKHPYTAIISVLINIIIILSSFIFNSASAEYKELKQELEENKEEHVQITSTIEDQLEEIKNCINEINLKLAKYEDPMNWIKKLRDDYTIKVEN